MMVDDQAKTRLSESAPDPLVGRDVDGYHIDSILGRDYPTLLGVLFFSSVLVIAANQLTDLAYRWIDPRLRTR